MMTQRWINYVLAVVVVVGMVGVTVYEQPRLAEERAEFLDQEVASPEDTPDRDPAERDPLELRPRATAEDDEDEEEEPAEPEEPQEPEDEPADEDEDAEEEVPDTSIGDHGVTASHPVAVEVGMEILDGGGNAVDAAVAVAYALGVVEPFGSGIGGGGALLLHRPGEQPQAWDYRETAPPSGSMPSSDIGVPGFVAGMEEVHDEHGTIELADLIEPAARLAEDGVEVSDYLNDRLEGAAHRLPVHLVPELFPNGVPIGAGETLRQPAYGQALRLIQDQGSQAVYGGELGTDIADAVEGLEPADLEAYEVLELEPATGSFAGFDLVSGAAPVSGPTVIQLLQIAERAGVGGLEPGSADHHHVLAQSWRAALSDRTELIADPTIEDVPLDTLLSADHAQGLADAIPADGFIDVEEDDPRLSSETDTTHVVVVDDDGAMVSMTNTLSNFFGSGLPVSGFFLNDQLKNFSTDPDSINVAVPGKRPRSFIAPTIVAQDDLPLLGIGSPGGRRIPMMTAQVLVRWAEHGEDLAAATEAPRFHLEDRDLEVEQSLPGDVADDLAGRGYQIVEEVPTTEYFGGMQALLVDHDGGQVTGVSDERRDGSWDAASR